MFSPVRSRSVAGWVALAALVAGCSPGSTPLADGTRAAWSDWAGKPIVLNYWAEWCAPCRHEIPELNALHRERTGTGMIVLGVNYDGIAGQRLSDLIERMDIEFPVLVEDPMERWGYPRPDVLPTPVIVGPDGSVRETLIGPQTRDSILAALRDHDREDPSSVPSDLRHGDAEFAAGV